MWGKLGGERAGVLGPAAGHTSAADRAHAGHRRQVRARLHPRAEDRQVAGVGARQQPRRHGRGGGGADRGNRRGVDQRQQLARLGAEQQHAALVRVLADRRVAGEDADRLQPVGGALARHVGRH